MKMLEGLAIRKRSVEIVGCHKGCLEYLGKDISFPWLYGGTGHAFITALDPGVDVSSPYTWHFQRLLDLTPNLGYRVEGLHRWLEGVPQDEIVARQREAWEFVRREIDRGLPCYGWELKAPYGGFWVVTGYDDVGYYYSGWETGGPTPWQKLGQLFVPNLEVRSVQLCEPATDEVVVREGIRMALRHAQGGEGWIESMGVSGPAAFDNWAAALEDGSAKRDDHTYNCGLWKECREMAVAFLGEVKDRLPGRCDALLDEAAADYTAVVETFEALLELHPQCAEPDWKSTFSSPEAASLVRELGAADAEGLACLERIVQWL